MRSLKTLLTAWVLLAAGALSAAGRDEPEKKGGADKVVLTDKDASTKVSVKEGATVQVKLRVQGGTGFVWTLASNSDGSVLKGGDKPRTERPKKPLPGAPTFMVFTFKAASKGSSKLTLIYHRPFEKGKEPAKKFAVTVRVK